MKMTTATLPMFETYGRYASRNYGAHALVFSVGDRDFYFSYKTLVAFRVPGYGLVVSDNVWGPTTGKHLNWIDGGAKDARLSRTKFEAKAKEALI